MEDLNYYYANYSRIYNDVITLRHGSSYMYVICDFAGDELTCSSIGLNSHYPMRSPNLLRYHWYDPDLSHCIL